MIAQIVPIVRLPRNLHEFDYTVPDNMSDTCLPGTFVTLPFRKREIAGLVWSIEEKGERASKSITRVLPLRYTAWDIQRQHAEWFARHYCISRATALKTLLPEFPCSYLSTGILRMRSAPSSTLHEVFFTERYRAHCAIIKKTLKEKKSILFFFPTIHDVELFEPLALTAAGNHDVLVLHSTLSASVLFSRWAALFDGRPRCIIATRMGAGVPLHNLGALVIDSSERIEHNQYDLNPRFDIRTTAYDMHTRMQCLLTYSSDAPRLEEYFLLKGERSGYSSLRLTERAGTVSLSSIQGRQGRASEYKGGLLTGKSAGREEGLPDRILIVNMRDEIRASGRGYISERLIDAMRECLSRERGVFLFLNRAGASRMIACRDCGQVFSCVQCGSPTRTAQSRLICDPCSKSDPMPARCSDCRSVRFHFIALGTEKIVELVKKEFPQSNVLEFTQEKHPYELIKRLHTDTNTDTLRNTIIVGTSYLPRACPESFRSIGCVGVLSADPLVTLSDFRSEERQVQLLFHLASLARNVNAQFILQTFSPEHKAVQALITDDYRQYAENALAERAAHGWPPANRLIRLRLNHPNPFLSSRRRPGSSPREIYDMKIGSDSVSHSESVPDPIFTTERIIQECSKLGATLHSKTEATLVFSLSQHALPDAHLPNDLQNYLMSLPNKWLIDIDPVIV